MAGGLPCGRCQGRLSDTQRTSLILNQKEELIFAARKTRRRVYVYVHVVSSSICPAGGVRDNERIDSNMFCDKVLTEETNMLVTNRDIYISTTKMHNVSTAFSPKAKDVQHRPLSSTSATWQCPCCSTEHNVMPSRHAKRMSPAGE